MNTLKSAFRRLNQFPVLPLGAQSGKATSLESKKSPSYRLLINRAARRLCAGKAGGDFLWTNIAS